MKHSTLLQRSIPLLSATALVVALGCGSDESVPDADLSDDLPAEGSIAVTPESTLELEPPTLASRTLTNTDRIEVYAMVLREVLGGETEPRGGVVLDPQGLKGLSDLERREVLVGIEALAPGTFFGTREEVLERERDQAEEQVEERRRQRDEKKEDRGNSGSSTAQSSVTVNPVVEEEGAPMLVLSISVERFDADNAVIAGNAWHSEVGDRTNRYELTWRSDRWRLEVSGPEVIE